MSESNNLKTFLSYSWADKKFADDVDNALNSIGYYVIRDTRDAPFLSDVVEFMNRVGKSDKVIVLISDNYLRSDNCMYELIQLLNTNEMEKRIIPVLIPNDLNIFDANDSMIYFKFWKSKLEESEARLKEICNEMTLSILKKHKEINLKLDTFLIKIQRIICTKFDDLVKSDFDHLVKELRLDNQYVIKQIVKAYTFNRKIQLSEVEKLKEIYPDNPSVWHFQGNIELQNKEYERAIKSYEKCVVLILKVPDPNNKHSMMLADAYGKTASSNVNLDNLSEAKKLFDLSLKANSNYAEAHNNYGKLLCMDSFKRYTEAEFHFKEAIRIAPYSADFYNDLGLLYIENTGDVGKAKYYFELAIKIDPLCKMAYHNLGNLLDNSFGESNRALTLFQKVIEIDSTSYKPYFNIGLILSKQNRFAEAKKYLELSIERSPDHLPSIGTLGNLMSVHFKEREYAKDCYLKVLKREPNNAGIHFNLSTVYRELFSNLIDGKNHYLIATNLDKKLVFNELDKFYNISR